MARNTKGSALLDLVSMIWISPVVSLMAVNVGLVVFAGWINDSACREAARAAAQQSNPADAKAAAQLAVRSFGTKNKLMPSPKVLEGDNDFQYTTFPDAQGKPDLSKGPFVSVKTQLKAKLPCPIVFTGCGFTDTIKIVQTYVYPIMSPNQLPNGQLSIDVPPGDDAETDGSDSLPEGSEIGESDEDSQPAGNGDGSPLVAGLLDPP